jgi:predicted nucleic acid-binding protein
MLTGTTAAPTRRILDAMLSGQMRYLLSIDLLGEYRQVLLRPRIAERHGLSEEQIDRVLEIIAANGIIREGVSLDDGGPDPKDAHLWALAASHPSTVLVTGDRALLEKPPTGASVMSPSTFSECLPE